MNHSIRPGQVWLDCEGKQIQAHGGSVITVNGKFYWYVRTKKRQQERIIYGIGEYVAISQQIYITGQMKGLLFLRI